MWLMNEHTNFNFFTLLFLNFFIREYKETGINFELINKLHFKKTVFVGWLLLPNKLFYLGQFEKHLSEAFGYYLSTTQDSEYSKKN